MDNLSKSLNFANVFSFSCAPRQVPASAVAAADNSTSRVALATAASKAARPDAHPVPLPGRRRSTRSAEQCCDNVSCASCAKLLHVQIERRSAGSIRKVSHRIPRPSASRASRSACVVHLLQSYNDSGMCENTFNKAWLAYFPLGVQSLETISSN